MNTNEAYYKVAAVINSCLSIDQLKVAGRYAAQFCNMFHNIRNIDVYKRNLDHLISLRNRKLQDI